MADTELPQDEAFWCKRCKRGFKNATALLMHKRRKHEGWGPQTGQKNPRKGRPVYTDDQRARYLAEYEPLKPNAKAAWLRRHKLKRQTMDKWRQRAREAGVVEMSVSAGPLSLPIREAFENPSNQTAPPNLPNGLDQVSKAMLAGLEELVLLKMRGLNEGLEQLRKLKELL